MATKNITDLQVVQAFASSKQDDANWPYEILAKTTGQPWKVCYRAMERAARRGLIDYGVSLRSGWLTERGVELLNSCKSVKEQ